MSTKKGERAKERRINFSRAIGCLLGRAKAGLFLKRAFERTQFGVTGRGSLEQGRAWHCMRSST